MPRMRLWEPLWVKEPLEEERELSESGARTQAGIHPSQRIGRRVRENILGGETR